MTDRDRARALGWLSVGLGVAETAAPRALARAVGAPVRPALVRTAYGLRELVAGAGLLAASNVRPWVWARVAGDVVDLATLAAVAGGRNPRRGTAALALAAVAGVTALDVRTALALGRDGRDGEPKGAPPDAQEARQSVTVGRPRDEVYRAWRTPAVVAEMMAPFAEVEAESPDLAHIHVRTPVGKTLSWTWEVPDERPGELFRVQTREGADVPNEARVTFRDAPNGRGTELAVRFRYRPPGGAVGGAVLSAGGLVPEALLTKMLRRFKAVVEAGEAPTLEGNVSARGTGDAL